MSRVIRGSAKLVTKDTVEAYGRAHQIIGNAEDRARGMVDDALAEAQRIREEAKQQGYRDGQNKAAGLAAIAGQVREKSLASLEPTMISIAIEAAKRVVRSTFSMEPHRIKPIVADLLQRTSRAQRITVHVHPEDVRYIEDLAKEGINFNIDTDPKLERGECVVESNLGDLDARFDVQLEALARSLRESQE